MRDQLLTLFVKPSSFIASIVWLWGSFIVAHAAFFFASAVKWYHFFNLNFVVLVVIGMVEHFYYGVSGFPVSEFPSLSYYRPNMFFFIIGIVIALLRLVTSILAIQCAKAYRLEKMEYMLQAVCVMIQTATAYQPPRRNGPHQQSTEHVV